MKIEILKNDPIGLIKGQVKDVKNVVANRLIADGLAKEVKADKAPKKDKAEKAPIKNKGKK
jgi:hypothetical protein